jgi:2-oxoglutarate dehydrogenase complex dehydrogenase (E1) component-like enzyme
MTSPPKRINGERRCSCKNRAIISIEQLKDDNCKISNADDYVWAQEEPKNMGI